MRKHGDELSGNLALFGVGVLFGASSPLARSLGAWLTPMGVIFARFLFALPFMVWTLRKQDFSKLRIVPLLPVALAGSLSVVLFTLALFNTKISLAIFFFYITNLLSSILVGRYANKESLTLSQSWALVIGLLAVWLIANPLEGFKLDLGSLMAVGSGVLATYGYYLQKRLSDNYDANVIALAQIVMGVLVSGLAVLVLGKGAGAIVPQSILLVIFYGGANAAIFFLLAYGFKRANLAIGTLLTSTELLFGPLLAFFIFQESLSVNEILGGMLIVVATIVATQLKSSSGYSQS